MEQSTARSNPTNDPALLLSNVLSKREEAKNVSLHLRRFLIVPVSHGAERTSFATSAMETPLREPAPRVPGLVTS